ncbi:hypothetical protein CANARDRAFT_8412 [[Candida] arabinofermentans NRRL YB-2248]|uniref:Zn(2)-C6 fungal-type domain-containing protein n=1 Tax=[Candida] arabinofermentans NRRL YB-2248 TaxID=983967 RepID=A0A1E4SZF8_9ASCO|nr:hypothetical protein CANARDRAFT_8412 [[Candida] arabinofermentans NRRL YB-2248]
MSDQPKPKKAKRQQYSRNGCLACKKRKVKCDEGLPACGRCTRLDAECTYYRVFKFQAAKEEPETVSEGLTNLLSNQELLFGDIVGLNENFLFDDSTSHVNDNIQLLLPDFDSLSNKNANLITNQSDTVTDSSSVYIPQFSPTAINFYDNDTLQRYDYLLNLSKSLNEFEINNIADNLKINFSETIHLQSFVKNVHLVLFPLATSYLKSPFITTFLKESTQSTYLLNAMLASGARFLFEKAKIDKELHLKSGKVDKTFLEGVDSQIELNDKYRVHYLSNCFNSLKLILDNLDESNDLSNNVESALLTSLLLTADLSSNRDDKWLLHLHGAKQFLSKYNSSNFETSLPLVLSRYLFSSLEISSGMATGSQSSLDLMEFQTWIPIPLNHGPLDMLAKFGLVIDGKIDGEHLEGGYKMYFGFSDHVIETIKCVIFAKKKKIVEPDVIVNIFKLIDKAKQFQIINNVSPFMIPVTNKYHPLYQGYDKVQLVLSGYYHLNSSKDETQNWYSFFDFLQILRIDCIYLYVLTSDKFVCCEYDSGMVQKLVKKCIQSFSFLISLNDNMSQQQFEELQKHYNEELVVNQKDVKLSKDSKVDLDDTGLDKLLVKVGKLPDIDFNDYLQYQIDHRICMFQWCLLIIGYCCVDYKDKLIVDCLMNKLWLVGIKSAKIIIEKVTRIWNLRRLKVNCGYLGNKVSLDRGFNGRFFVESDSYFPFT